MGALLGVILLITLVFVLADTYLLWSRIVPLLSEAGESDALIAFLIQSGLTSILFVLAVVCIVFVIIAHFIARPVDTITTAMRAFAATQERQEVALPWAPKEVHELATAFDSFSATVDEVHRHDMEVSRVKSDFISTAAHQLRTPLTGIRWALEALERDSITENQKALVENAKEKSKQLVAVVGTLLDISSIESGKYKYDMQRTELNAIVGDVTHDFVQLAANAQVSLLFEKTTSQSPVVMVDTERIRWVLNNLIENAIRYTPAGGSVRVLTEQRGDKAYVWVRDTGIGIPEQDRGNIFTRFYRASNAVTKENAGNGLGLYIARTIANDHGGDLTFATNENGPGTTFTLSLPITS